MADTAFTEITTGLQFPEGPVAMPDGSVILTEMFASRITRVSPDGTKTTVAEINGSPNGLAVGPDGALYLCNNGNAFTPLNMGGLMYPGPFDESKYIGGRIQRVDIATGTVTDLYTHCGETQLRAPNDIVFDKQGGFYFTDHGTRTERSADRTGIYYAKPDGSFIEEVAFPIDGPNGIGLSPDENTLYWAETHTGRVYQCAVTSPGKLAPRATTSPRKNFSHLDHRLADALEVMGEWWTPLIIVAVSNGSFRFEAIQNSLGIARNILTDRLNTLVAGGVLEKRLYTAKPQRYEYRLTGKGEELIPILQDLEHWGEHLGATISPRRRAPRRNFEHLDHRLADALEIMGEWWTPLIIMAVGGGVERFEAIQNSLGIARNILTDRLNTLVAGGVLEKYMYTKEPQRYEYRLTGKGEELIAILQDLERWGTGLDSRPVASTVLCGLPGYQLFDSLAVDGDGNVCVATIVNGGITVISPSGEVLQHIAVDDRITTNICFGGPDYQTAYITASSTGRLLAMKWPYKGLKLNY